MINNQILQIIINAFFCDCNTIPIVWVLARNGKRF